MSSNAVDRVRPTGAALGADVAGIDLTDAGDDTTTVIRAAIRDHLVIRVRDSAVSDEDFMALSRSLGEIEPPEAHTRTLEMTVPGFPEMSVISNVVMDGVARGEAGDGELLWHTDHSFLERPAGLTLLLARAVPREGGNTSFANMFMAFNQLPDDLKLGVQDLSVKHQGSHTSTGERRPGYLDLESDDPRTLPGAVHPLVRTHPESGRRALYLGRRFGSYIPGLSLEESDALLDALWEHATRPEFTWTQEWREGDLVIWDNRCTLHRRDGFAGAGTRVMQRLMTRGERPV